MIVQIKVNKGGIGKSFITANLAHLLALANDKKVLILTTDNQNCIFDIFNKNIMLEEKGLRASINSDEINYIRLRDNLHFIPFEKDIKRLDKKKTIKFIEKLKKEYEYILIDSTPTINLDNLILDLADKIIIPAHGDKLCANGIANILKKSSHKVVAIMFNKFNNTRLDISYLKEINELCKDTTIIVPTPIPQWSYLNNLVEKGKTIWESKSTSEKLERVQNTFIEVAKKIG